MNGFTVPELLIGCLIALTLTALGAYSFRNLNRGTGDVTVCANDIAALMQHAHARSVTAGETTSVAVDLRRNSFRPGWNSPGLPLRRGCLIRSAVFGVAGSSGPQMKFYPTGSASPGHILIVNERAGWCRLTQSLRGARTMKCFQ